MSSDSNHEAERRDLPAVNAENAESTETDVQGYLLPWSGPFSAPEPPPGTTDPYGPPMPGRDIPTVNRFFKPIAD